MSVMVRRAAIFIATTLLLYVDSLDSQHKESTRKYLLKNQLKIYMEIIKNHIIIDRKY